MRKILSFLMMAVFSAGLFAATETTVYYAVPGETVGTFTVKLNVNFKGDGDDWHNYVMTKTALTHETMDVYKATFTDAYNGLGCLQFQLYNGDKWVSEVKVIDWSWTTVDKYNGKMWVHGGSAWVDAPAGDIPSVTLYFVNAEDWNGVMAYVYDANSEYYKDYPGEELVKTDKKLKGKDVYSYTFPETYTKIGFVSKDGTKNTGNYAWSKTIPYYYEDGDGYAGNNWHAEADLIGNVTVYFYNNLKWDAVKTFVWGGDAYKAWPGEAAKKEAEQIYNTDVYAYTFPENYTNIIFNNGAESPIQTADLKWDTVKPYFVPGEIKDGKYEGKWYAKADIPAPAVPATFYLTGDSALVVDAGLKADKAWSASAFKSEKDTFELNLKANQDYKLNLTLDGDWGTKTGYSNLSEKADGLSADEDDNICFKLNTAGVVKVVYFVKDEKLTYKLIGDFYVKPVVKKELKLVPGAAWNYDGAKFAAYLWGDNGYQSEWTPFFAGAGDTLKVEINAEADSMVLVRFADYVAAPTWDNENDNIWGKIDKIEINYTSLVYTVTSYTEGTWDVYVPVVIPAKFYVTGDSALVTDAGFPGKAWNPDAIKSEADTLTLSLKAGVNYQLKVTDGTWNTIKGYDKLTKVAAGLKDLDGDNHNIGFRLNQAGDVKVVCTSTVFELIGDFYVPTPHYYIAGTMNEWNVGANELVAGNGDTLSLSIALKADSLYEFKVVKVVENDTTWYGMQETAAMVYGNSTGWWLYKSEGENNQANVGLQTTKAGDYTFIFKSNENNEISVVIPEPEKKYFAKYAESGKEEWIWHAMTEKDGLWLTDTIVYLGGGMNIHESMEGDGKYYEEIEGVSANDTAYFAFNPSDSTLAATLVGKYVAPETHYYIAGTMNEWNVGANELVAGNGDTLSLSIALKADSLYEFKVVKVVENDTTWYGMQETAAMVYGNSTGWWLYKSEGENNQANVGLQTTKAGDYTFIFKSNENNEISVVIPEPEKKYFAKYAESGKEEWIWHAMTEKDGLWLTDTIVYLGGGMNIHESMEGDGKYYEEIEGVSANDTAYFAFNPSDSTLAATLIGKYVTPEPTFPVMEIAGAWDVKEEAWVRHELVVANDSLTATYTVSLEAGSYEFKMIKDNKWLTKANNGEAYGLHREWAGVSGVTDEATENLKLTADVAGTYTFTWTYANDSVGITFPEKSEPVLTDGFYLVGSMNEWTPAAQYLFKANPDAEGEYSLDITFAEGDDFKVVYVENDVKKDWYPGDGTDNYLIDADHTGTKTVYFRPDYQGGEDWYYHCIFVAANGGTGVEETMAAGKAAKVLRNGHFFILKGDKIYNVTGAVIR